MNDTSTNVCPANPSDKTLNTTIGGVSSARQSTSGHIHQKQSLDVLPCRTRPGAQRARRIFSLPCSFIAQITGTYRVPSKKAEFDIYPDPSHVAGPRGEIGHPMESVDTEVTTAPCLFSIILTTTRHVGRNVCLTPCISYSLGSTQH